MKQGANKLDQNKIAHMVKEDKTVDQISAKLRIDKKVVKSFYDFFKSGKSLADLNRVRPEKTEKTENK